MPPLEGIPVNPADVPDIEIRLREYFEDNYESLSMDGGRQLGPQALAAAWEQVLLYWRKLSDLAVRVTDTEVKLTLPDQVTPKGRRFSIDGVVDIVREEGRTTMYDVKTHEADYVRANIEEYERQLNVYAHIWQSLRGQDLDAAAIISTVLPPLLHEAVVAGDEARAERELEKWNPLVDIPFDQDNVDETIADFARVVDAIEDHRFAPPPVAVLKEQLPGQNKSFATAVCINCDARFSCASYRAHALRSGLAAARTFKQYFAENVSDSERSDWLTAGLDATRGSAADLM